MTDVPETMYHKIETHTLDVMEMLAVFVNTGTVLAGSLLGILLRERVNERLQKALMTVMGLVTVVIGVSSAIRTAEILCVILCLVIGTLLGEWLRIDSRIESAGDRLRARFAGKGGQERFTEGFVTASILFCIGSMTIMGSLEAGISKNYSIIFAKSVMDLFSSMALAAAMGIGVLCSALFVLVFQGGLTLLAGFLAPALSSAAVTEMSAVGGTILIGMAVNLLDLGKERIRVANMLPGIFLPLAYFPIIHWIGGLFK